MRPTTVIITMLTPSTSSDVIDFCTVASSKKRLTMSVGLRPSNDCISPWANRVANSLAVRAKIRRCMYSATTTCIARSRAEKQRKASITRARTTTGQSSTPKATVLTRASMAAGVTIESRPTPRAKARIVQTSRRSRRSNAISRAHGLTTAPL